MASVTTKLGIAPGSRVGIDGLPIAEATRLLEDFPGDAVVVPRDGEPLDQLILVAPSIAALESMLPDAWSEVSAGGRLWVWYRKGANRGRGEPGVTPLHRDTLQTALAEFGLIGVTLISVDEVWSSMRVRPL